ncbi:hypothetical protein IGI04_024674 [Brassica rapa subsp. trilocularis]|uniref:Uncharacterized protein n=1 Tax=Brassica rapa subsp. trilocularis TaxID=1813537 RepID=A0ABQ7M7D1_BRACM|nr:hypothetical protein IGI04_024674 [Brassica rapa subsp. trilocularis]
MSNSSFDVEKESQNELALELDDDCGVVEEEEEEEATVSNVGVSVQESSAPSRVFSHFKFLPGNISSRLSRASSSRSFNTTYPVPSSREVAVTSPSQPAKVESPRNPVIDNVVRDIDAMRYGEEDNISLRSSRVVNGMERQIRDSLAARSIDFVLTPDFAIVLNHFKILNITGFLLFLIGFCSLIMIAQTLSYLNFSAPGPIVHGKVKLDNILFDEILSAKISDFGAPIGLFLQRSNCHFTKLTSITSDFITYFPISILGSKLFFSSSDAEDYNVGQIGQQVHGAPANQRSGTSTRPQFLSRTQSAASSCRILRCVGKIRKRGVGKRITHPVNIERDKGLEEITAARVLVGSRIIVQSHFSHRKNSLIHVVSVSQLVEKGTCDDVQLGSWKREGIQSRRMNFCWLRLGQAEHALYDAKVCRELKPDWSKRCCFREGVALCFLQRSCRCSKGSFPARKRLMPNHKIF